MAAISNLARDILSQSINAAFAPTASKYLGRGFLVMPAADLTLTVVTKEQYELNGNTIVGLTPVSVFCAAGQWLECPIVWVGASSGATVNIALI